MFFLYKNSFHSINSWSLGPGNTALWCGFSRMVSEFLIRKHGKHSLFLEGQGISSCGSWRGHQRWPWRSCPECRCSPWLMSNSHQYWPAATASWPQGQRRMPVPLGAEMRCTNTQPWRLSPCIGQCGTYSPAASPHRTDGQLGHDDSLSDDSSHLLGTHDTKTNMTNVITDSGKA